MTGTGWYIITTQDVKDVKVEGQNVKVFAQGHEYRLCDSNKAESLGGRKNAGHKAWPSCLQRTYPTKEGQVWVVRGEGRLQSHRQSQQKHVHHPWCQIWSSCCCICQSDVGKGTHIRGIVWEHVYEWSDVGVRQCRGIWYCHLHVGGSKQSTPWRSHGQ